MYARRCASVPINAHVYVRFRDAAGAWVRGCVPRRGAAMAAAPVSQRWVDAWCGRRGPEAWLSSPEGQWRAAMWGGGRGGVCDLDTLGGGGL